MEAQEINAKARTANAVAHIIRVIGVLFFVAMAFGVLSWKWAVFAGVACMNHRPGGQAVDDGERLTPRRFVYRA
jgi:hypothetical protein